MEKQKPTGFNDALKFANDQARRCIVEHVKGDIGHDCVELFLSNPVIEKTELWRSTEYFQDREMGGKVVFNAVDVAESIADILNNSRQYNQKIVSLRDRQLFNLGRSEEYLLECVDCIISGYSRPEWWTIEGEQYLFISAGH